MEQETKMRIRDWVFLLLMVCALVGIFAAIITIRDYADMLRDPPAYALDEWGYNTCLCYDAGYNVRPLYALHYNKTQDLNPFQPEYETPEYGNINISDFKFGVKEDGTSGDNRST